MIPLLLLLSMPNPPESMRPALVQGLINEGIINEDCDLTDHWESAIECTRYWIKIKYNSPPLEDADRLPSFETCDKNLLLSSKYIYYLESMRRISTRESEVEWYSQTIKEAESLRDTWLLISYIQDPPFIPEGWPKSISWKAQLLHQLRERVGSQRYYNGEWGPCVPTWRFRDVTP